MLGASRGFWAKDKESWR